MRSRVLIYGGIYLSSMDSVELTRLWLRTVNRFNPGIDWLLIDSASPAEFQNAFGNLRLRDRAQMRPCSLYDIGDNIGHASRNGTGRDGWGRAFCVGLRYAIDMGYEYALYLEGDCLTRVPVGDMLEAMRAKDAASASPWCCQCDSVATELVLMDVRAARECDWIGKYDWQAIQTAEPATQPEHRLTRALGPSHMYFPWNDRGGRDEGGLYQAQADARGVSRTEHVASCFYIHHTTMPDYRYYAALSALPISSNGPPP